MKLLIVCQYFYPEQFQVNDLCFELAKSGHEVTVLTGLPNYPSGVIEEKYKDKAYRVETINGVEVIRSWLIGRGKGKKGLVLNYMSFALSASIKALFMKKDFDLILVYQLSPVTMAIPGILLKKLTKKPLALYCFDLWPESIASVGISASSRIYKMLLNVSKWIYKNVDHIFISSKLFNNYFMDTLDIQKELIHFPVYADAQFESLETNARDDQTINLLFAGNIGEMQSVETIIYAANELKKEDYIKFHIVGDGSSREKCENLANKLGLRNIIFHGKFPLSEMPRFYSMADAFLITLKNNEIISYTLPNKVQSYMATGKPIIGAINGETELVIKEAECGFVTPAEDYKELAKSILLFANQRDKHRRFGLNAKSYYNTHYSKQSFLRKFNELITQITLNGDVKNVQR